MVGESKVLWEPGEGDFNEIPGHLSEVIGEEGSGRLSGEQDNPLAQPSPSSWHQPPFLVSSPSLIQT